MNTKPCTNRGKLPSLKICCYCQPTDDLQGIERQEAGVRPLLDAVEMLHPEEVQSQHESRVTIPTRGTEIYKATLVSLLNQDPQLSHERLVTTIYLSFYKKTNVSFKKVTKTRKASIQSIN